MARPVGCAAAEALDDRASFWRFCGFAAHEPTPERTTFARFRRGLDRALFEAVTRQLEAKGVMVRTGTLVDGTLVRSASIRRDGEARWVGHRRCKPMHGYKEHIATDESAGLVRGVKVTTANVHDAADVSNCGSKTSAGSASRAVPAIAGGCAASGRAACGSRATSGSTCSALSAPPPARADCASALDSKLRDITRLGAQIKQRMEHWPPYGPRSECRREPG